MTFTYAYTPCSLCGRVAVCRSTAGERDMRLRRLLAPVEARVSAKETL